MNEQNSVQGEFVDSFKVLPCLQLDSGLESHLFYHRVFRQNRSTPADD